MYCLFLFWIIGVLLSWQADCFQLPFYFVCCSFFVSLLLMYSLLVYYFLTTDPVVFEDLSATSWGTECFLGLDQGLRKVVESCCWSWKWQFLLTKCIVTCLLIKKIWPLRNTCCHHPYIHTHPFNGPFSGTTRVSRYQKHTHTHPFNGPLSGTTRVGSCQKGKNYLDFTEARDSEWQWHQLGHMQVCTLLQTDNHTSTPPLSFLQAGCPSCRPTNSVKALKA